jgi:hypothetical protein
MSVDNPNVIDFVGIDKDNVVLAISDHLEWDDENEHLLILQDKLNTYLEAIENGELLANYPNDKDKKVIIEVIFKYSPNDVAKRFLEMVGSLIESFGYGFRYNHLPI